MSAFAPHQPAIDALCRLLGVASVTDMARAVGAAPPTQWPGMIRVLIEAYGCTPDMAAIENLAAFAFGPVVSELVGADPPHPSCERVAAIMNRYAASNSCCGVAELVFGGTPYRVRLTVGAAVRMGDVVGAKNITDLIDRVASPNPQAMADITAALLAGNGHDVPPHRITGPSGIRLADYVTIITALFDVGDRACAAAAPPH